MKIKRLLRNKVLIASVATVVVLAGTGVSYGLTQANTHVNSEIPTSSVESTPTPSPTVTPTADTSPVATAQPTVSTPPTPTPTPDPQATPQSTHDAVIANGYIEHDAGCFDQMAVKRGWYNLTQDAIIAKIGVFKTRGFDICLYWYDVVSRNPPFYPLATGL